MVGILPHTNASPDRESEENGISEMTWFCLEGSPQQQNKSRDSYIHGFP